MTCWVQNSRCSLLRWSSSQPYQVNLLDKLHTVLVHGVVQAGSEAAALVEQVEVCPPFNENLGTVKMSLGQGMVQGSEGSIIGSLVDISPSIWQNVIRL